MNKQVTLWLQLVFFLLSISPIFLYGRKPVIINDHNREDILSRFEQALDAGHVERDGFFVREGAKCQRTKRAHMHTIEKFLSFDTGMLSPDKLGMRMICFAIERYFEEGRQRKAACLNYTARALRHFIAFAQEDEKSWWKGLNWDECQEVYSFNSAFESTSDLSELYNLFRHVFRNYLEYFQNEHVVILLGKLGGCRINDSSHSQMATSPALSLNQNSGPSSRTRAACAAAASGRTSPPPQIPTAAPGVKNDDSDGDQLVLWLEFRAPTECVGVCLWGDDDRYLFCVQCPEKCYKRSGVDFDYEFYYEQLKEFGLME